MTSFALVHMKGVQAHRDVKDCARLVSKLNRGGFSFTVPKDHLVFADYTITAGARGRIRNYECDGFHLGLFNEAEDGNPTMFLPPGSYVYLDEAQKYFNSRESKSLSDYVSRYYELHRHWRLHFMLAMQRPMLIDKNIRELVEETLYVEELTHRKEDGRIVGSTWQCKRFNDTAAAIAYIDGGKLDAAGAESVTYTFEGNIFRHYDSYAFMPAFLKGNEDNNFNLRPAVRGGYTREEVADFNDQHVYEVPETYYKKKKG